MIEGCPYFRKPPCQLNKIVNFQTNSALSYFDYLVDLTWLVQDAWSSQGVDQFINVSYENIDFS